MLEINLSIVIFLPLAAGLIGAFLPARLARWVALAGALAVLAYVVVMVADYDARVTGLHYVTDAAWIPELGVRYTVGIDGLNLFLVALTALLWVPAILLAATSPLEHPRLFFFHMALAETAVLGAFCAQDLALFVVFFDLMLVPFYFLIGGWGRGDRVAATTKFVIYTLVGSLLMLAGAVALGVLATPPGGEVSFSIAELARRPLAPSTQSWIFLLFAAAFVVKAPLFPLHGWMPDTYRATPIPVLIVLSAVLSKVGVYGFLRVVVPILPDAAVRFQDLMVVLAVASILYGSALAFTQDDARLVVGYSSVAQLGFIVLGIFSLDPKGAQGAVMQMVNHGLVVAPLFLIIALLAARAGGSESLARMGGIAFRAPVLAALFLIVTLATLAMPGSPNFAGELLILFGAFETKLVYGLVASAGVVLAAVYMIRFFQRAMHNRVSAGVESRDLGGLDALALAPLVAVIVALGVYPQLVLERSEADVTGRVGAPALARAEGQAAAVAAAAAERASMMRGPAIDYGALSPLLAVIGGCLLVLMAGLFSGPFVQRVVVPVVAVEALVVAIVLSMILWRAGDIAPVLSGTLSIDALTLGVTVICCLAGIAALLLSARSPVVEEVGSGEYCALLLGSIAGMIVLAGAESLITLFVGLELLSIPLYVLCAGEVRRRTSLESGLKYLVIGSVGSATLLYGLALVYGASGSTDFAGIDRGIRASNLFIDPLFLTGIALSATGLAFKASVAPFHQWTPDVYEGAPTPITAFMAVATKAAAFAVFLRLFDQAFPSAQPEWGPALAALALVTIVIGNVGAIGQDSLKRMLAWSGVAQAGYLLAGVVVGTQLGLQATFLYLVAYLLMNLAAFAVVVARERVSEHGDSIRSLEGLGTASPWLAWPMTIAMLSLAGFPATVGFMGKFHLIQASVGGGYAWLGVAIVVGSMISLVYYLRVLAVMWMGPIEIELPSRYGARPRRARPAGGWSPEADAGAQPEVTGVAVVTAALTILLGIFPAPLFELARQVGESLVARVI